MYLPIIESFIKEVNNLAGDPNSPSFDEELSSCIFVMANETNPVNLGYKFFMLNISLTVLRKILCYLSILKLRSDSLRSQGGEPINQAALSLALKGAINAIEREEMPVDSEWRTAKEFQSDASTRSTAMETSSGDEALKRDQAYRSKSCLPSESILRQSSNSRSGKNANLISSKIVSGPQPGTSKQSNSACKQISSESGAQNDSVSGKYTAKLSSASRSTGYRTAGRRGRTSSSSSLSSATTSSSPFGFSQSPSPSNEPRTELSDQFSTVPTLPRTPLPSIEPMILSPGPPSCIKTSTPSPSSPSSPSSSSPPSASSTVTPAPDEPAFGLIVPFSVPVSIPIQQGLVRVLSPYRDKIETTPICGNQIFIKLKSKTDVYFLKRQIEILTRLSPRIVVTHYSRYQLDVPKPLAPTIKEFVNLNLPILSKGEYFVSSRPSSEDPSNTVTYEILVNASCQQEIENSSCFLKVGSENRQAVRIGSFMECSGCFFCYDDAHTQCSQATLMSKV